MRNSLESRAAAQWPPLPLTKGISRLCVVPARRLGAYAARGRAEARGDLNSAAPEAGYFSLYRFAPEVVGRERASDELKLRTVPINAVKLRFEHLALFLVAVNKGAGCCK